MELCRPECGTEQRGDRANHVVRGAKCRIGSCTEDPPQCLCIGGRGDAQAKTTDAAMPSLGESAAGIGFTVRPFVAVVVREPIGQDDEETPAGSSLPL